MAAVRLFAKSRSDCTPPSVFQHCDAVGEASVAIWESIEPDLADSLRVNREVLRGRVRNLFVVSALLHDVAKANSAFQAMVQRLTTKRQPVRHEVLAGVLLMEERFWGKWFARRLDEKQRWMIAWAVAGHHLQMRRRRDNDLADPLFRDANVDDEFVVYLDHEQVREILKSTSDVLGSDRQCPECKTVTFDVLDESANGLEATLIAFTEKSDRLWKQWYNDGEFKRDLGVLKALLIAADVAGSALPVKYPAPSQQRSWIIDCLGRSLDKSNLRAIYNANLGGRSAHDFQLKVAASENLVTVVTAGCGNGKTTAAYMWAERWAHRRKLFFTYPTTGTASAGFKDYLLLQPELHRTLIHGRAEVDLDLMLESDDVPPIERAQRLEALNAWSQQAIACTADTVLGLIQNQRRPLFAFPAIARGAFVFDEVHSYDRRMFSELLHFLRTFPGVPVLIMSASIPPKRLEALQQAAHGRVNPEPIRGEKTLEEIKRYSLNERTEDECWREVERALNANNGNNANKVLWVCNTVGDAIATYREAKRRFPQGRILLYHSRYRYKDRVLLQNQVIEEFRYDDDPKTRRKYARPAIAITTQVCEMSLDISANMLVTACCPLPSLVQRLGRLNRYAAKDDAWPAYIYRFAGRPYHEGDAPLHIDKAIEMVQELEGKPCDQATLGQYIDKLQSTEELPKYSAWLDGGWQSEPLPAREGDNSITVVRLEDLPKPARLCKSKDVIPFTIPMLFKCGFTWTEVAAGYPVAAGEHSISYSWDEKTKAGEGASWQKAN